MSSGLNALDVSTRKTGLAAVSAAAAGDKPWTAFVDDLEDLSGDELRKAVDEADAIAAKDPDNFAKRMTVAYAYAVWRDFLFATAAGRFPYAMGAQTAMRGLYEGGRIHIDATVKV